MAKTPADEEMSAMIDAVLIYTTWPDAETASTAAVAAVEARLAACANVFAPTSSVYRWEGQVERAIETPVLFKTTAAMAERLRTFIVARHPYELPCVLSLPAGGVGADPRYLAWIGAETGGH